MKRQLYDEYGKATFVEVPSDSKLIGLFKHEREDFGRKYKTFKSIYAISDQGVFSVYPLEVNHIYAGWKIDESTDEYKRVLKWSRRNLTLLSNSDLDGFVTKVFLDGF